MNLRRLTALLILPCVLLTGCPAKSTIAGLTNILGNAAASVASVEGNPGLAAKLTTDTAAAVTIINNWKSGTPSQNVVEAINLVIDDLNLFPSTGPYAPLIVLALSTAESIIEIVQPPSSAPAIKAHAKVATVPPAATAKEFKARWNALAPDSASKIK